jgi:hypothetical protein
MLEFIVYSFTIAIGKTKKKRKKIVLNSKWRQNPRWMPKYSV